MCGIAGVVRKDRGYFEQDEFESFSNALKTISHRGPDDEGKYFRPDDPVILLHRRLAIQGLGPQGAQPMSSQDGRFVIVYNGEIYNFGALSETREFHGLVRGHSDTELLLFYISRFGVRRTLELIKGMFAFCLWDRHERKVYLARDLMGEKPLYIADNGRDLVFASELKFIEATKGMKLVLDHEAFLTQQTLGYVPEHLCIYRNVRKLLPGTFLELDLSSGAPTLSLGHLKMVRYQTVSMVKTREIRTQENIDKWIESLLEEAVESQLISDVPIGAFLSGGIDSSLVVALASKKQKGLRTFNIDFEDQRYSEAKYAAQVARHFGCEHVSWTINEDTMLDVLPLLTKVYDEPFSDSSSLPTILLARNASKHVKVCLSGDGADELFLGYERYTYFMKFLDIRNKLPDFLAANLKSLVRTPLIKVASGIIGGVKDFSGSKNPLVEDKIRRALYVLEGGMALEIYSRLVSLWQDRPFAVRTQDISLRSTLLLTESQLDCAQAFDLEYYLPSDILFKVDRATMAFGLESRAPFLDRSVVHAALSLHPEHLLQNGSGKKVLKRLLARHLPAELINRPKMGFSAPVENWLKGPLAKELDGMIDEERLRTQGLFNFNEVKRVRDEHAQGVRNWKNELWSFYCFQRWFAEKGPEVIQ